MDLAFEDSWPVDVQVVSEGHFCVRYYDGQDQRIVAHEFNASFAFIAETRGHIAEWSRPASAITNGPEVRRTVARWFPAMTSELGRGKALLLRALLLKGKDVLQKLP